MTKRIFGTSGTGVNEHTEIPPVIHVTTQSRLPTTMLRRLPSSRRFCIRVRLLSFTIPTQVWKTVFLQLLQPDHCIRVDTTRFSRMPTRLIRWQLT